MMHGREKSDLAIVAVKSANKDRQLSAESMEPRARAEGNAIEHGMRRTPGRESMSHGLDRVRQAAKEQKGERFTALLHHIDAELLGSAYGWLRMEAAAGVDGVTWEAYGDGLGRKLVDLHDRIHRGAYRAQPSRRVYIPKPDGRERPLGIAALEDKIVQRALVEVLNAIWEEDFLGFSYGFRPGRGQHDALDALAVGISQRKVNWILDADITGFLDTASYYPHGHEVGLNSWGWRSITLIRSPFCLPRTICTASSSPRLTRCNTVWRETLSTRIASRMGRKSSPASPLNRATRASVKRIRHGAQGVSCSPAMIPSLSKR